MQPPLDDDPHGAVQEGKPHEMCMYWFGNVTCLLRQYLKVGLLKQRRLAAIFGDCVALSPNQAV